MKPSRDRPGRDDEPNRPASEQDRLSEASLRSRGGSPREPAATDSPPGPAATGSSIAPVALEAPLPAVRLDAPTDRSDSKALRVLVATTGFALVTGLALFGAYRSYEPTRTAPAALAGYGAKLAAVTRVPLGNAGAAEAAPGADPADAASNGELHTMKIKVALTTISAAATRSQPERASGSAEVLATAGGHDEASSTSLASPGERVEGGDGEASQQPPKGERKPHRSLTAAMDSSDWPGVEPGSAVPGSTAFEYHEAPSNEALSTERQIPPTRLVPDRRYSPERLRVR